MEDEDLYYIEINDPMSILTNDKERDRLRRESNRQAARNSRKKKKEYVSTLSESISKLTRDMSAERSEFRKRAREDEHRHKLACIGRDAFQEALEMYGPMSQARSVSNMYKVENLMRNVAPPHSLFLWQAVDEKARGADSCASETWNTLTSAMGLQPEQIDRLNMLLKSKKLTDSQAMTERSKLQFVFSTITRAQASLGTLSMRVANRHSRILEILSPEQASLLLRTVQEPEHQHGAPEILRRHAFSAPPTAEHVRAQQLLSLPIAGADRKGSEQETADIEFLLGL